MILGCAVGVMQSYDHRNRSSLGCRETPSTDTTEKVNGLRSDAAGQLNGSGHVGRDRSQVAVQHDGVANSPALGIDRVERYAGHGFWPPVIEHNSFDLRTGCLK